MKGIFKKVAGAFVEMEEKPIPPQKTSPPTQHIQQVIVPTLNGNAPEVQAFKAQFAKILADENERNFPGNDYYEFIAMKNAMSAIPEEIVRYHAAFAGWSVGGKQTKESLLGTAKVYLGLVEKEIKDFEEAYQAQYAAQVTKNEQVISQKSEEIRKYTELINGLTAEVQALKQENLSNTAKLTNKHDAFMTAGEEQRREILEEIDKINNFVN